MEYPVLEQPARGEASRELPPALPCANCGTPLFGPYCSRCGQHGADYHRSLWRLAVDFLDNVFAWDNRVLRTLAPLVVRPGFLTQEFLAGRRVRYVHPLRLFLFTSAVCLALLHFGGGNLDVKVDTPRREVTRAGKMDEVLAATRSAKDAGLPGHPEQASPPPLAHAAPAAASPAAQADPPPASDSLQAVVNQAVRARINRKKPDGSGDFGKRFEEVLEKKINTTGGMERFGRDFTDGVRHRLSWVALAMLPIFALMLRGVYWRSRAYYFEHLIFSLHYHTFGMLFWTAYSWLGTFTDHIYAARSITGFLLLGVPAYLFLALRQVYGGGGGRTCFKVVLLAGTHLLAIVSGLAAIGALSFFSAM